MKNCFRQEESFWRRHLRARIKISFHSSSRFWNEMTKTKFFRLPPTPTIVEMRSRDFSLKKVSLGLTRRNNTNSALRNNLESWEKKTQVAHHHFKLTVRFFPLINRIPPFKAHCLLFLPAPVSEWSIKTTMMKRRRVQSVVVDSQRRSMGWRRRYVVASTRRGDEHLEKNQP